MMAHFDVWGGENTAGNAAFAILGSGSKGNAAWIECDGAALLLDCGFEAFELTQRLQKLGRNWKPVRGVILTHVHKDHWSESVFEELLVRGIPLWLHRRHIVNLRFVSPALQLLEKNDLLRFYQQRRWFTVGGVMRCWPVPVSHDSEPTLAFRIEMRSSVGTLAVGYASDLGCSNTELLAAFTDVALLAVEFNHDPHLQRHSGRPAHLIRRVLGDKGHLSNQQAAALVEQVLQRSQQLPGHLVQLHLSEECNRPEMALEAVRPVVQKYRSCMQVVTAMQHVPSALLPLLKPST
jgi:phosphoribosyl 1,2-cyclic phosphodiesterase